VVPKGDCVAKIISRKEAAQLIKPRSRVMFGGFLAVGVAEGIIDALVEAKISELHGICIASDYESRGVGKLVFHNQLKSVQASHFGTNKTIQTQMNSGQIVVEMIPQGTLMERIRAQGAGLGGVLTPTGVGTIIENDKEKLFWEGKEFLWEKPIRADFAVLRAYKADQYGNLIYQKTARNSNPIMAMAADVVIVEVDEIIDELDPEAVITPGIFVDYLVLSEEA